jgi:hypothetical protein
MVPVTISLIVFAFVFGGSLFGIYLRAILPETLLTEESKDLLKLGMGLMATMTALVLGLQLGSAQSAFEAQERNLIEISAKLILLDRALAHYGPETKAVRDLLRRSVAEKLELIWPEHLHTAFPMATNILGERSNLVQHSGTPARQRLTTRRQRPGFGHPV